MSDYNFNFISEEDQQNAAYGLCRAGVTVTGALVGSLASPAVGPGGVYYGAVAGYALWGPIFCKRLAPAIKKKLFSRNRSLENHEVAETLRALREARPTLSKPEALNVLATLRQEAGRNPSYIKDVA